MMYVCVKHTFMFKHLRSTVHLHIIFFLNRWKNIDDVHDTTDNKR